MSGASSLSVRGAVKTFFGVRALAGVDLEIGQGEIHALLGENGAGKSTLIKLLAGVYAPDGGVFTVGGRDLPARFTPADVAKAGLRFVHQDYGLIDTLSIAENIAFVSGFAKRNGLIDHGACERAASSLLAALELDIPPGTLVGRLGHAEKAIVALSRALQQGAKVIVLDEVTAALPTPDAARVHKSIRAAQASGVSFLYVSHRLEEVFDLCDRMTVLRDGRNAATADVKATTSAQVIEWIAGKKISTTRPPHRARAAGPERLVGRGMTGGRIGKPVDIAVKEGEILGVTGILGSGYAQICEWLCGLDRPATGTIVVDQTRVEPGSTRRMRQAGCEIVAGDRTRGAFPELSVRENLFADKILRTDGRVSLTEEARRTSTVLDAYRVRPRDSGDMQIRNLSGGNQQKVLFARALEQIPKALVLIDPTAGVDIGARSELHQLLRNSAAAGAAVLFGSSDFEEIAAISDRALVIRDGAIGAEIEGDEVSWERLFAEAHGGHRANPEFMAGTTDEAPI